MSVWAQLRLSLYGSEVWVFSEGLTGGSHMEQQPDCSCGVFPMSISTYLLTGLKKLIITQICQTVTVLLLTLRCNHIFIKSKASWYSSSNSCFGLAFTSSIVYLVCIAFSTKQRYFLNIFKYITELIWLFDIYWIGKQNKFCLCQKKLCLFMTLWVSHQMCRNS